jgi:hypothetical protein
MSLWYINTATASAYMQVFGETPMADVEIIFPDKVVGIKPFQLVNLAITVITALMAGAMVFWKVSCLCQVALVINSCLKCCMPWS